MFTLSVSIFSHVTTTDEDESAITWRDVILVAMVIKDLQRKRYKHITPSRDMTAVISDAQHGVKIGKKKFITWQNDYETDGK